MKAILREVKATNYAFFIFIFDLLENMAQVNAYETKIRHEYGDLTDCAYLLHAVFMHKGKVKISRKSKSGMFWYDFSFMSI